MGFVHDRWTTVALGIVYRGQITATRFLKTLVSFRSIKFLQRKKFFIYLLFIFFFFFYDRYSVSLRRLTLEGQFGSWITYFVIPFYVLNFVILLLISPRRWSIVTIIPRMLLIPTGNCTNGPLLPQLGIRYIIRSLSLVMLVHLSELKFKFLVGYLHKWIDGKQNKAKKKN